MIFFIVFQNHFFSTDPREKYLTPTVVTSYFLMFLICGSVIVACAVRFLVMNTIFFSIYSINNFKLS